MTSLIGRDAEKRAVAALLDAAAGESAALIVSGEPGIGKTTLWLDGHHRAGQRGIRVLSAQGNAAEPVLAYAGLADLLADVDEVLWKDLPHPQRRGLAAALLVDDETTTVAVDRRAVGAALLTVLKRLATQSAVLVAIDDLQWLDRSSAAAIAFAARRLTQGVAWLGTARTDTASPSIEWFELSRPDAVRRVHLPPLVVGELQQVMNQELEESLARPAVLRVHEISGGNPFYALELARELSTSRRSTDVVLPGGLADLVRKRIDRLGTGPADALLAIASSPNPSVQLVAKAIDTTPSRVLELLDDAETQAVVAIDGDRLRFEHPILAHGVYGDAAPGRRRAMHRRLATLVTDTDSRARHLALAATTADPTTLHALDSAARNARLRGAPMAAAELLELAIGLGGDTPKRRIRLARNYLDAGDPTRARALLEETVAALAPGTQRAEALAMQAVVGLYGDDFASAADVLGRALGEVGDHLPLRVQVLVSLSFSLLNTGDLEGSRRVVQDAVASAERLGHPQLLAQALSLRAHVRFRNGDGLDETGLRRALESQDGDADMPAALRPRMQKALLMGWSGKLNEAYAEMENLRRRCIERGEENELVHVTFNLFQIEMWRGNFDNAATLSDDAATRALQLGTELAVGVALTMRGTLAAYAGRDREARTYVEQAYAASHRCGAHVLALWPLAALVFLEVSLQNHASALSVAGPLLSALVDAPSAAEISVASFVPDAAEASISLGRLDDADLQVERLERNGARLDRAWMLAVGARCRAMLSAARGDVAAGAAHAQQALAQHDRIQMPFERGRTLLTLGRLERRLRHWGPATAALTEALSIFEAVGTPLWAAQARTELDRGTSGRPRSQGLTPTERRVAQLAATGMTNQDIAAALFVTPKTVEVYLSRIYHKLGIRTRIELCRVITDAGPAAPAPDGPIGPPGQ